MAVNDSMNRLSQVAGTQKAQTGTGYTNLNRFFQANKNNQLGQKVTGNLQSQVGNIQGQLGEQKSNFEKESEKNKLNTEQNKQQRDEVIGRFSDASTAGGEVADDDVKRFQSFIGGQYAGPSGLQDTSALASQASELRGQTSNLSPAGTQELLRRSVGQGGRYTQGQQRLDSLLMDRSGLKQVGREAAGLYGDINRANLAAQGQAQALKNQAQQFGAETTEALKGALTGLDASAEAQLTAAQQGEKDRLARIQAIQDFAAGKTAKRDAQGNIVKDQYGNTVYDTTNPRGTTDVYSQMDKLRTLLQSQGAQPEEIEKLMGKGSFADLGASSANITAQRNSLQQQLNKAREDANTTYENERITVARQNEARRRMAQIQAQMNSLPSVDYASRGIAGQALGAGAQEAFYNNLAKSLANSQAAQGLTLQGVASDPLRQNYSALQQLLGQTADLQKYKDADERYQAGQFLLNPDLIKRATLG